jgi:hypothetical protein
MKIALYANNRFLHHIYWIGKFGDGLKRHGVEFVQKNHMDVIDCDLAIMWSARHRHIINHQVQNGKRYIILERGFVGGRDKYTHVGYDGLNGRANFMNKNSPPDRWEKLDIELKDWDTSGTHVLVVGQIPDDASTAHVDINDWAYKIQQKLGGMNVPYLFRPHPGHNAGLYSSSNGIIQAVRDARCVVTFNSNAGVDSILEGTPVVTFDAGSMVRKISSHNVFGAINFATPPREKVQQWANDIAYAQWTGDEMSSGETWEHIKNV